jgi:hypothetical protein
MALTFPLTLDTLFEGLIDSIEVSAFDLPDNVEGSGLTGAGEVLTADAGPRLWQGEIEIARRPHVTSEEIKARLDLLRYAGRSFLIFNPVKAFPKLDPTGAVLGAAQPKIQSLPGNNRELVLYDLPAAYALSVGDYLGFSYGTNPVRRALHRLAVGGVASSGGVVTVEASSFIRNGATAGTVVTLIKPVIKAVIVPGSVSEGKSRRMFTDGIKFSWRQTLR